MENITTGDNPDPFNYFFPRVLPRVGSRVARAQATGGNREPRHWDWPGSSRGSGHREYR